MYVMTCSVMHCVNVWCCNALYEVEPNKVISRCDSSNPRSSAERPAKSPRSECREALKARFQYRRCECVVL